MSAARDVSVRVESLQWPVTVLGFGARIGIWFQGCSVGCAGCCAAHTWSADEGRSVPVDAVLDWVRGLPLDQVDGVTLTGGEPFEQPQALQALVSRLRREVRFERPIDMLCYSGFAWNRLLRRHGDILALLDAVIAGPYVERLPPRWLRGSSNQVIHCFTDLGRGRYPDTSSRANELQLIAAEGNVRIVGIPGRGDLGRMEARLAGLGVTFGEASWRMSPGRAAGSVGDGAGGTGDHDA